MLKQPRIVRDEPVSIFTSMDPAAIAWRVQQMDVDNAIESVERDPEADALVASWDAAGVPIAEQIERLKARATSR